MNTKIKSQIWQSTSKHVLINTTSEQYPFKAFGHKSHNCDNETCMCNNKQQNLIMNTTEQVESTFQLGLPSKVAQDVLKHADSIIMQILKPLNFKKPLKSSIFNNRSKH